MEESGLAWRPLASPAGGPGAGTHTGLAGARGRAALALQTVIALRRKQPPRAATSPPSKSYCAERFVGAREEVDQPPRRGARGPPAQGRPRDGASSGLSSLCMWGQPQGDSWPFTFSL